MSNSEAGISAGEGGLGSIAAHQRAARLVSEAEARVVRGRGIVARQRDLAETADAMFAPRALTLLETFEGLLALFEANLAAHQRLEFLAANERAIRSSEAIPIRHCAEPIHSAAPTLDQQAKARDIGRILEILREGGYYCELVQETLH